MTVRFDMPIDNSDIPLFRGAVINAVGQDNVLFHNHLDDTYRYKYPLIQYKRIGKKAAIVCIDEGTEAFGSFFSRTPLTLTLAGRTSDINIENISARQHLIQIWEAAFHYHLNRWIALNQVNYRTYCATESLAERLSLLEHTLVGNIIAMAKTLDIRFDKQVKAAITDIGQPYAVLYKDNKLMAFDAVVKTNVSLPDYIGLGKGASTGFGIIHRINNKQ